MLCFSLITPGHIQQESHREKNCRFGLVRSTPSTTIFTKTYTKWFPSFLFATLNDKNFIQADQVKMFVENLISLKPAELY